MLNITSQQGAGQANVKYMPSILDKEETERSGVKLSSAQRTALMQSLMDSHGIAIYLTQFIILLIYFQGIEKESMPVYTPTPAAAQTAVGVPQSICVLLSNMFNPAEYA